MKIQMIAATLVLALVCTGAAVAGSGPSPEMKAQVKLLEVAGKAGLDDAKTVQVFGAFKDFLNTRAGIMAKCAQMTEALTAAASSGQSEAALGAMLGDYKAAHQALKDAEAQAMDAMTAGLSAAEKAHVMVFMLHWLTGVPHGAEAPAAEAAAAPAPAVSPSDAVMQVVKEWAAAMIDLDMDKVMTFFSDDFEHYEYGDKEGIGDFLQQAMDMGYLDDVEILLDDAEVQIEGDEATVYPVDVEGAFGAVTLEFIGKKEGDTWRVISMDASGI